MYMYICICIYVHLYTTTTYIDEGCTAPLSVCKSLTVRHLSYIVPCFGTITGTDSVLYMCIMSVIVAFRGFICPCFFADVYMYCLRGESGKNGHFWGILLIFSAFL